MTIKEAHEHCLEKLKSIYEEGEATAITELVLEHLTRTGKTERRFQLASKLSNEKKIQFMEILQRLQTHEPVQYVLNEAWFCGLKFYVDKNVLIPRPETEELVEWIISGCKFPIDTLSILDIGSGSGCIPIALKKRLGKADVWSCDVSSEALKVANLNAVTLGINVNFIEFNFLNEPEREKLPSFDIIVSNPPYIPQKDKENMRRNVTDHEPATALFVPDNDALIFYKAIAAFGKNHLTGNGVIYMEINESLGEETAAMFQLNGYKTVIKKDMQGKDRMIKAALIDL